MGHLPTRIFKNKQEFINYTRILLDNPKIIESIIN